MTLPKHLWQVRVYYEDTDHGGVVYHANYLKYMDRARTEMLRAAGIELDTLEKSEGLLFAVTRVSIRYNQPARFNDLLAVESTIVEIKGVRIGFHQSIRNNFLNLAEADIEIACMNRHGSPARIPGQVTKKIQALKE